MFFNSIVAVNASATTPTSEEQYEEDVHQNIQDNTGEGNIFSTLGDGLVGILTYPLKLLVMLFGMVVQGVGTMVAATGGDLSTFSVLTPDKIFFNQLPITSINFFDLQHTIAGTQNTMTTSNPIYIIRDNIATWYITLRNLAIVILLCILIYVGIRMAISTIAEDKAKYKQMLFDWLVSFALIFIMHYIIIITISVSNALVDIFYNSVGNIQNANMENYVASMLTKSFSPLATLGWGATLVYCAFVGISLAFLVQYIKRMVTIGFLILISPIITVTYSMDRIGDNKSQALDAWLKEFVYNILVQPFHCLIYLVFASTAVQLLDQKTIGTSILAIVCFLFIMHAEGIIRKIFGFDKASTLGTTMAAGAVAWGALNSASKLSKQKPQSTSNVNSASGGSSNAGRGRRIGAAKKTGQSSTTRSSGGLGGGVSGAGSPRGSGGGTSGAGSSGNQSRVSNSSKLGGQRNLSGSNNQTRGAGGSSSGTPSQSGGMSGVGGQTNQSSGTGVGRGANNQAGKSGTPRKLAGNPRLRAAGRYIANKGVSYLKGSSRTAGAIAFGMMGASMSSNHLSNAITGAAVGAGIGTGVANTKNKITNIGRGVKNLKQIKVRQSALVGTYDRMLQSKGSQTDPVRARNAVDNIASNYLKMSDDQYDKLIHRKPTGTNAQQNQLRLEQEFALKIRELGKNYRNIGYNEADVEDSIIDTFDRIDSGKIKPPALKKKKP